MADYLQEGESIANQVNIFGDVIREYVSPEDGIVIGHAVNPVGQTGERILHLGRLMTKDEKKKFEEVSGCSLEGVANQSPGHQDIPSLRPV